MLFHFQKFSEFGINIFEYADVFDFLIAPFSDFKILLFAMASTAIVFVLMRFDIYWKEKYPKSYSKASFGLDKKHWYNSFRYLSFITGFLLYLYASADFYGKITKEQILNQPSINIKFSDNEVKQGKLIGKTKDVMFLLTDEKVQAIPITSLVKEIEIIK